jgi:U4/U6 small nuclear ribonucleoprotein PRP31
MDYIRAVQCIGNEMDITRVDLESVLPGHTSMIVRIGASTTDGRALSPAQLEAVLKGLLFICPPFLCAKTSFSLSLKGCAEAFALQNARRDILLFIESRMSRVAPNLSVLVGTNVAAQLMTAAGGKKGIQHRCYCSFLVSSS